MKKQLYVILVLFVLGSLALAENRPERPQLTAAQISQLEAATTKEAKDTLMQSWGFEPPKDGMRPPHEPKDSPFKNLTDDQKSQLKAAKTKEERDALLKSWGINPPPPPPNKGQVSSADIANMINNYQVAQTDDEKAALREQIKHSFYGASDEDKKTIRAFLVAHPDSTATLSNSSSSTTGSGAW